VAVSPHGATRISERIEHHPGGRNQSPFQKGRQQTLDLRSRSDLQTPEKGGKCVLSA
jgi:hypothetical protein